MKVAVSVTTYVYRFLEKRFGPGPYDLCAPGRNALRLTFLMCRTDLSGVPKPPRCPGATIILDLGTDPILHRIWAENQELLCSRSALFYQAQFMHAFRDYVKAQENLSSRLHLPKDLWNKKQAVDEFLKEHNIGVDEYDFHSLYRQMNRLEKSPPPEIVRRLGNKYRFRASEVQYFRPVTLVECDGPRLFFEAFSRSKEDIVPIRHRIPRKNIRDGTWMWYASEATQIINSYLEKGYSIK